MKKYSEEHNGYSYMLNVIDTFSRFAWSLPIKKEDGATVSKAFEKIIKSAKSQGHLTALDAARPDKFLSPRFTWILRC
jgi:hypothetical protein